jgi:hypothetical protein
MKKPTATHSTTEDEDKVIVDIERLQQLGMGSLATKIGERMQTKVSEAV